MDLRVFWTDAAIEKLDEIFDSYKNIANIEVAQNIVDKIVDVTIRLKTQPKIGQKEPLLSKHPGMYIPGCLRTDTLTLLNLF